ncbi:DUF1223 domain-containing protein [Acuticoccus sp. MNP-M23]|uniref:DUF1223 domain-containing protein n=1 Tax=Acuticoccus sp. MNP-M23 TaxID=3072793 RepID=UPI00281619EE|nr:DUF1223 domain-containing protein [Acuticoccus sp. MNP-M23]WMS40833.1 DUF1223 domain-containing protein [Acuticoccus sp. MNP-M23]
MIHVILGALTVASATFVTPVAANAADAPSAFVELFTSQGCASCPAADALLHRLEKDDGILAVTLPVQLWDFLGWEDTLATKPATRRQMEYSRARGDRDVYTPQMVVNGREDVVGSDHEAILDVVRAAGRNPLPVPIDLEIRSGVLHVDVGAAKTQFDKANLWVFIVDEKVVVPIRGGENRGRKLTYHNVVREMRPIGMWTGGALTLDIPLSDIEKQPRAGCYVIAQVETYKGPGPVIGAAKLDRLFPARPIARRKAAD